MDRPLKPEERSEKQKRIEAIRATLLEAKERDRQAENRELEIQENLRIATDALNAATSKKPEVSLQEPVPKPEEGYKVITHPDGTQEIFSKRDGEPIKRVFPDGQEYYPQEKIIKHPSGVIDYLYYADEKKIVRREYPSGVIDYAGSGPEDKFFSRRVYPDQTEDRFNPQTGESWGSFDKDGNKIGIPPRATGKSRRAITEKGN